MWIEIHSWNMKWKPTKVLILLSNSYPHLSWVGLLGAPSMCRESSSNCSLEVSRGLLPNCRESPLAPRAPLVTIHLFSSTQVCFSWGRGLCNAQLKQDVALLFTLNQYSSSLNLPFQAGKAGWWDINGRAAFCIIQLYGHVVLVLQVDQHKNCQFGTRTNHHLLSFALKEAGPAY